MSSVVDFTFAYGTKATADQLLKLCEITGKSPSDLAEGAPDTEGKSTLFYFKTYSGSVEKLLELGLAITISGKTLDCSLTAYHALLGYLDSFAEKLNRIETRLAEVKIESQQFNNKVGVHVSNTKLMEITNTMVMEDACTDALGVELRRGWRILAVCVQPDQRRPDYILGHTDALFE